MHKVAVIFDMDGVLVDTIPFNYRLWQKYFAPFGIDLKKHDFQKILGMEHQDVVKTYESEFGVNINDKQLVKMLDSSRTPYYKANDLIMSKSLINLLSSLKKANIPLAVATGSKKEVTNLLLTKNGLLEYFNVVVTADDIGKGKPDPDIYLKSANKLGVNSKNCVVIEDAASGIAAAHAAGMKTVGYHNSFNQISDIEKADSIVDDFSKLSISRLEQLIANT